MVEATLAAAGDAALMLSSLHTCERIQPPAVATFASLADGGSVSKTQDAAMAPAPPAPAAAPAEDQPELVPAAELTAGGTSEPTCTVGSVGVTPPSAASLGDDAHQPAISSPGLSVDHGLIPLPMFGCNGTEAALALPAPTGTDVWRPREAAASWLCATAAGQSRADDAEQTRDLLPLALAATGDEEPAKLHGPAAGTSSAEAVVTRAGEEPPAADDEDAGMLTRADALSPENAMATVGGLLSEDDSALEDDEEEDMIAAASADTAANGHPPPCEAGAGQAEGTGMTEQRLVPGERSLHELGALLLFEKILSGADTKRSVLIPKVRAEQPRHSHPLVACVARRCLNDTSPVVTGHHCSTAQ